MSHYILIHGAWEESRIWDEVAPVLEQQGHRVTALDLPGHGENSQPIPQVTMASYVQFVVDAISQLDEKVVLVAHSMAGAITSQVAERIPEKIERLIYVAAFLLNDGDSVLEAMQSDSAGELLPAIVFSDDQSYASVPEEALRRVGFHDSEEAVIQRVLPLMAERQATEPFMAKVVVTEQNFGSVPKTYIRTAIDKVTTPALQDKMISNWDVESVLDLESGHFPAFSVPEDLAALLLKSGPRIVRINALIRRSTSVMRAVIPGRPLTRKLARLPVGSPRSGETAMTQIVSDIAFTRSVKAAQQARRSRKNYERMEQQGGWQDKVTPELAAFIAQRDSFYLGTASEDGRPYIQHRGGPRGFIKVLDEGTLGFADFAGNAQYISVGNLDENDKAFIFLMDYPNRRRIKIWGAAEIVEGDVALLRQLTDDGYRGKPQRAVLFHVEAWDVNCPQHITPRWTEDEFAPVVENLKERIEQLQHENQRLREHASIETVP